MEKRHEELKSLMAPFALGAVTPEEAERVRDHIISCSECMAEAERYTDIVSSLVLAAEPEPLPEGFIEDVMARVHEHEPISVVSLASPRPDPTPTSDGEVLPMRRGRPRTGVLVAAAAFVTIVVLAASLIATTGELSDVRGDLDQERDRFGALIEQQGGMRLGGPTSGTIGAMLPTDEGGVFLVHGLKDAPDDHTYQVWLTDDDQTVSAGTFAPTDGVGTLIVDQSLEGVESVAVTVEPTGGSKAPTGLQVLRS